jgi:hypothetical protein
MLCKAADRCPIDIRDDRIVLNVTGRPRRHR